MYILDFLMGFPKLQTSENTISFEYRILCSGELYNSRVLTSDWRKSESSRILFDSLFTLIVCSHPFDEYPQELALRFSAPLVTEKHGQSTSMFYPDDDIARDLAALLTLFCRRLITVAGKVREIHPKQHANEPAVFQDWPIGLTKSLNPVYWERKPFTIEHGVDGVRNITDYNPPPCSVDAVNLNKSLANLTQTDLAESLILTARLYSVALQQLEYDVDIAYQLLVAAVETTANKAIDYKPTDEQMIEIKKSVFVLAKQFGLKEDEARQLAIEACKGISWTSRKFTKFLLDNTNDKLWENDDDLFKVPARLLPTSENYETVLNNIYTARGKLTHGGYSFPLSSAIGIGPTSPSRAFTSFDWSSKPFPPVVWFERVVSNALNSFIENSLRPDHA